MQAARASSELTVFLVDDEPLVLSTLKRALERLGAKVRTFTTPHDALKIAKAAPPEGIVSDYYMPDENGVDFLQQVEQALPDCARVILTGGRVDERLSEALEAGTVQRLVKKPWSEPTLREMLASIQARTYGPAAPAGGEAEGGAMESGEPIERQALDGARVLVVDDDSFFLEVCASLLAKLGYQAECFTNLAAMNERLNAGGVDVVLMDLLLEGESGVAAIGELRASHPHLPVIAVTGSQERKLAIAALQSGAGGVLHKPLDTTKLEIAMKHSANLKALDGDMEYRPDFGALLGLQHAISSGIGETALLDALLQQMIRLVRADRACIFLSESGQDDFSVSASYGCSKESLEEQMPFYKGLCSHVYERRQHQMVVKDRPAGENAASASQEPQTVLALPIRGRDSIVGVVVATRDAEGLPLGRDVIEIGLLLAGEVGQALERRRVEEQSRDMERSVMRRDKLVTIGELASGVAHEINNPLGYVSSNVHSLKEYFDELLPVLECLTPANGQPDPAKAVALAEERQIVDLLEDLPDCIRETLSGIDRVLKIVNDLRNFARDDAESKEATDINQVLDGAIQILWNQLKHKAELVREFGDLPAIQCFPSQLGQVFLNLLYNAVQAIERSGRITVSSRVDGGSIQVEIADDGCGMSKDVLDRIFEPFYTTKPRGVGTGLGLSIARKIIERHGGRINAKSEVGHGTTFIVRLPIESAGE